MTTARASCRSPVSPKVRCHDACLPRPRRQEDRLHLLAAHFADAIDLDALKRHQDRIRAGLADVNRRAVEHSEHHTGGRAFLHDSLRLLTDAHHAYTHSGDADRRIANQAFYTRMDITDDEQLRPTLAEPFATIFREAHQGGNEGKEAKREHSTSFDVACSRKTLWVVSKAPNLNTARRLERLDSAWDKGSSEVSVAPSVAPEPGSGVVSNPSRRNRTPLTEKEVEAIRTARAEGERVVSIAERFGIHRCTVLHYTKTAQSR